MTREEFIKKFAVLGLASPFMASMLSSCNSSKEVVFNIPSSYDGKIIIIGAGVTGITAGHILHQRNIDFEILEASSIHGGRVKKAADFADFPIDIGGEWIHKWIKAQPPLAKSLLENTDPDFPTFINRPTTYGIWKNGKLKQGNGAPRIAQLNDYKFSNSTWFDFFDQLVTSSLKQKIHYNSPVNHIDYSKDKVIVKTDTGKEYTADKVLVTVPIKILQNDFIKFEPNLPAEQVAAIHEEWMPDGLKVFIEFSEKFYPEVLVFGSVLEALASSNHSYYDQTYGKNSTKNILGLFAVGEPGKRYTSLKTDEAIIKYILNELDEIFDGKASKILYRTGVQNLSYKAHILIEKVM
jgi:monoamine oxidase